MNALSKGKEGNVIVIDDETLYEWREVTLSCVRWCESGVQVGI